MAQMDRGDNKMKWIDCSLPWKSSTSIWDYKEEFDAQVADLRPEMKALEALLYDPLQEQIEGMWLKILEDVGVDNLGCLLDTEAAQKHPLVKLRQQLQKAAEDEFWRLKEEPVYIEHDKRKTAFEQRKAQLSFKGRGLNKVGTLIEVKGKTYLIGHMNSENTNAGCCGSSCFEDADIVTKYAVIWSQDTNP